MTAVRGLSFFGPYRSTLTQMADQNDLDFNAVLSALPPDAAALTAWERLSREQQIALYRAYLGHPDCDRFTGDTPDDILAAARANAATGRG